MNKPVIRTYDDLVMEQRRLKAVLDNSEREIREEFSVLKRKLKPVTKLFDFVEKLTTRDSSNPLLITGIEVGVNLFLKNVLLKNASWVARLVMPFIVKNFLSHEAQEHPQWLQKVQQFFKKTFGKKEDPQAS